MTDMKCYRLTVRLLEDMHSGSGTGSGDTDALQMRDRRGLPVLRASHLKGLLLVAGEELVRFDSDIKAQLQTLLGIGGKQRGQLRLTALRLTESIPDPTLIWTSSAREEGGRRSMEDTLRVVEYVKAGSLFTAELRAPADPENLLGRLIKRMDRLGSDRNRGDGLITACLDEITPKQRSLTPTTGNGLRLRLRNLEPLCLPATGSPGNLIRSLPFVRGQVLRGALMGWALARQDREALATLAEASIGDALPVPPALNKAPLDSLCVLPIPLSVLTPKPSGGNADLPWWIERSRDTKAFDGIVSQRSESEEKPKRPSACEFLARDGNQDTWQRYSPCMTVHLRNQTADLFDISGKPLAKPSLFSMEEIAEDTHFIADLRFPDEAAVQAFVKGFAPVINGGEWLTVGREGRPVEVEGMNSLDLCNRPNMTFSDTWTLTLVSDLVARGKDLGFLTGLDSKALIGLAGLELNDFPDCEKWKMRGFAETEQLHGFNAASGLRRVPALAIRRGSCWQVTGRGCASLAAALAARIALGERTNEGCGRFVINLQPVQNLAKPESHKASLPRNRAEERLSAVQRIVRIVETRCAPLPSLSQLQWLRGYALSIGSEQQLLDLLEKIEKIPVRRPKGGADWKNFPIQALRREIDRLPDLAEKKILVSLLVQRLALQAREKSEEQRA